jgi:hypothetical protein
MKTIEEKRTGIDRRQFCYSHYFPERRKGVDRRTVGKSVPNDIKKKFQKS